MTIALREPTSVAVSPDGCLIAVADTGADRVLVVDPDGRCVAAHEGIAGVTGVTFGSDGTVVACEPAAGRVVRLGASGRRELLTGLRMPVDAAATADGGFVVADRGRHELWRVRADGEAVRLAGSGREGVVDGPGTRARLAAPAAVAVGAQGVFVVESSSGALRVVDGRGRVATLVGPSPGGGGAGAALDRPSGVAAAPDGSSIYVADTGHDLLRLWSGVDGEMQTIPLAGLRSPRGIALLPDGRLLVADARNSRIALADLSTGSIGTLGG